MPASRADRAQDAHTSQPQTSPTEQQHREAGLTAQDATAGPANRRAKHPAQANKSERFTATRLLGPGSMDINSVAVSLPQGEAQPASSPQAPLTLRRRAYAALRKTHSSPATAILVAITKHYATLVDVCSYLALGLVLYAALYLLLGEPMLPFAQGWSLFFLWIIAHIGGFIAVKVGLPALLGMLVAGIVLKNIPQDPVRGLPMSWSTKIRTGGLAVILMRAGLKIDKQAFRSAGKVVLRLAFVPMLCEAVVDSWCFYWLFGLPIALAFAGGFIMSAISPTVLVTGMLELQRKRYGEKKLIPSIQMAAAGLDSIGAIVGFAVASGVALPKGNLIYSILSGPLQVLYGGIAALAGTLVCSCTLIWNNALKRMLVVLIAGLAIMWLGLKFEYLGASSVGCLLLTVLTSFAWEKGFPPRMSKGARPKYAKGCDANMAIVWLILVQPLLFGAIGVEIDFDQISNAVIVKTIIILALGMCATRFTSAFLVLFMGGFTIREQLFMSMSWVPKATIQGALGSLPLMLITSSMSGKPDFQQYEEYGNDILHATTFSIILAAPVGLLIIALLGPQWLSDDDDDPGGADSAHAVPSEHTRPELLNSMYRTSFDSTESPQTSTAGDAGVTSRHSQLSDIDGRESPVFSARMHDTDQQRPEGRRHTMRSPFELQQ